MQIFLLVVVKPEFFKHPPIKRPKIGLVLSGGGARGLSHIGVIKVLEKENIPIHRIVGTSMGSVIGGLYSAGLSVQEIKRYAMDVNWKKIFIDTPQRDRLFSTQRTDNANYIIEFRLNKGRPVIPTGLTSGHRLMQLLTELTLEADLNSQGDFDKLPIPFRAVATDMVSGHKVVINRGPLAEAMRASFAVPFAFTPVELDSMLLFDGGMVDNLPVDVVRKMDCDFIIAVDVKAPLKPKSKLNNPLEVLDQIITLTILNQEKNETDTNCFFIVPDLKNRLSTDFTNVKELISLGEKAANAAMPLLRKRLSMLNCSQYVDTSEKRISKLYFKGIKNLSVDKAKRIAGIKVGSSVNRKLIREALKKLYESGYFEKVSAEINEEAGSFSVTINVKEYSVWKPVVVRGTTVFPPEEIAGIFRVKKGCVMNWHAVTRDINKVLDKYHSAGYVFAAIDNITETKDEFIIHINDGIIKALEVEGNKITKKEVIEREFNFKKGCVFRLQDAKKTIRQIYSTNLFKRVILKVNPGIRLAVRVEEKTFTRIQLGLRYDRVRLGEGFVRYIEDNLLGTGNRWVNRLQYGPRREKYSSFIKGDRLAGSYFFHKEGVYVYKDKKHISGPAPNEYSLRTLRKIGLSASIGRQIQRLGHFSVLLRTENFPSDTIDREWSDMNLGDYSEGIRSISVRTEIDDLDREPFPTSGRKHYFSVDYAHDMIGGTEKYMNFVAIVSEYYTFFRNHTLYPRLQIAYANNSLPPVEKHSIGGYSNILTYDDISFFNDLPFMGYKEQAFSGDCLFLVDLKYRWKAFPWMYFFLQYDIGDTWERKKLYITSEFVRKEFINLKQGLGLGVSFDTPIGPATAVLAQALNAKTTEESRQIENLYLSIGYEF